MFRVFLATYLALFACFLPALHTCEPVVGDSAGGSTAPELASQDEHQEHPEHNHHASCVVCRLSGDSGGVLSPPLLELTVTEPVPGQVAGEQPVLLPFVTLEEILPRAPPA